MKYGIGVAGVCFSSRELGVFHFISSSVAIGGTRGWDVIAVRPTGDALVGTERKKKKIDILSNVSGKEISCLDSFRKLVSEK